MRESRRNVQNIARLQILINNRRERVDVQQRRMRAELTHRQLIAHAPAAATHALNNKDIILVDVRAHAAARYGKGDHQVI